MPAARESLLDAAYTALGRRPWTGRADGGRGRRGRGVPADPLQRVRQQGRAGAGPGAPARPTATSTASTRALSPGPRAGAGADAGRSRLRRPRAASGLLRTARDEPPGAGRAHRLLERAAAAARSRRRRRSCRPYIRRAGGVGRRAVRAHGRRTSPDGLSGKLRPACDARLRIALSCVVAPSAGRQDADVVRPVREVVRALLAQSQP